MLAEAMSQLKRALKCAPQRASRFQRALLAAPLLKHGFTFAARTYTFAAARGTADKYCFIYQHAYCHYYYFMKKRSTMYARDAGHLASERMPQLHTALQGRGVSSFAIPHGA